MDEMKVGDVVQLRSGGLRMTVTAVENESSADKAPMALCDWFEYSSVGGEHHRHMSFPIAALRKVEPSKPAFHEPAGVKPPVKENADD
jgi:uncharacterized protein YodC (DUF2158 family)